MAQAITVGSLVRRVGHDARDVRGAGRVVSVSGFAALVEWDNGGYSTKALVELVLAAVSR